MKNQIADRLPEYLVFETRSLDLLRKASGGNPSSHTGPSHTALAAGQVILS
jgi:hypothetical protein